MTLVALGLAAPVAVGCIYAEDGQAHPHGKREQVTSLDLYHALPNVAITHAAGMVPLRMLDRTILNGFHFARA